MIEKRYYSSMTNQCFDSEEDAICAELDMTEDILDDIRKLRSDYIRKKSKLRHEFHKEYAKLVSKLEKSSLANDVSYDD